MTNGPILVILNGEEGMALSAKPVITDLNLAQLEELIASFGENSYRARQLLRWVYRRLAFSYGEMTDLPKSFREKLTEKTVLHSLSPLREVKGQDNTVKMLFALADSRTVESALMSYPADSGKARYTVCVSTQVGCVIGCPFCATGQQGFERNLSPGEIIEQVLYFERRLREPDKPVGDANNRSFITNLVFMGMGEPLANYKAVLQAVEMLNSPKGFGLGARNMVISTAGLVPQIKRLSCENFQVGLAVSLHASENALRDKLVPLNRKYPLEVLIAVCREYVKLTGRRISFEYALFEGINDSISHARALARLISGLNCHVNLITANRTASQAYRSPVKNIVLAFEDELKRQGVNCTLRESRGADIDAGCGQLRSRFLQNQTNKQALSQGKYKCLMK